MKQLAEDPWADIDKFYKVGDLVNGKVTKLASFGAFVGLEARHRWPRAHLAGQRRAHRQDQERAQARPGSDRARDQDRQAANAASACPSRPPTTRPNSSRPSRSCSISSSPAKTSSRCNTRSTRPKSRTRSRNEPKTIHDRRTRKGPPFLFIACAKRLRIRVNISKPDACP